MKKGNPFRVYLVCNAKYHDTDFVRLELLKLLAEHQDVCTWVGSDYRELDKIEASDLLITYTCDVVPTLHEQRRLRQFVNKGGRWFGLHGTNAIVEFVGPPVDVGNFVIPGKTDTPNTAPELMKLLGSRFVAHPPNDRIKIRVVAPDHPVVRGLDDFEIYDEPYYCEIVGNIQVLLDAHYTADAPAYVRDTWSEDISRPQMYEHLVGKGAVLYLTLGHCRGKYDLQPLIDEVPVERCGWEEPIFYELLRRGIAWGLGKLS